MRLPIFDYEIPTRFGSVIQNRNQKSRGGAVGGSASDSFSLVVEIVDNDVVAHLVGRGVKHAPGVEPRQLIDEPLPVEIRAEHKRVDLDAALGAAFHFLQRLMNDN